ncbi:hypothetical protein RHGRI_004377 [Rhododendron griersonianum]|uniref:Uncharacterized protein n=1 Tax=Rhododendron griersonianum TaxID=479676 RepID=A0AAV6L9E8_9ERIC|nr:hypothetical protein RHGRI_004377 [Rhododendron griersonianum]
MEEEKHHQGLFRHHHKEDDNSSLDYPAVDNNPLIMTRKRRSTSMMSTLHEKHMEKKDPEHAHEHKLEEEIGAAAAASWSRRICHLRAP